MKTLSIVIGRKLRELRKARGMTLAEMAQASGHARSYVSDIERGIKSNISIDVLQNLATALGVRPSYLTDSEALSVAELVAVAGKVLPSDMAEWLAQPNSFRWVRLAQTLDKQRIPPEAVEGLIDVLKSLQDVEAKNLSNRVEISAILRNPVEPIQV